MSDLSVLIMRLKSGEYDGAHIMQDWIKLEELEEAKELERINIDSIAGLEQQLEQANSRRFELRAVICSLVSEYCDRGGSEGFHHDADDQSCPVIRDAMKALDNDG